MALYKIIRVYEVPGKNQIEATNRMMEALVLQVEEHYHVLDVVRTKDEPVGTGEKITLKPSKGWLELFIDQIRGK